MCLWVWNMIVLKVQTGFTCWYLLTKRCFYNLHLFSTAITAQKECKGNSFSSTLLFAGSDWMELGVHTNTLIRKLKFLYVKYFILHSIAHTSLPLDWMHITFLGFLETISCTVNISCTTLSYTPITPVALYQKAFLNALNQDMFSPDDRFFSFSTCGWRKISRLARPWRGLNMTQR